ncbi:MAG: hypothetical protein AAGU76_07590 [Sedimentibacter sp.]|uniref:hypothetical protein n=1 Tax=Sedimentibacter sp. TaxID=1960295 RepID=UPI0031596F4F
MKIRFKKQLIFMFIIIATGLSYFYLIDSDSSVVGIGVDDIALIFASAWGVYIWLILYKKPNPKFEYAVWMLCTIILIVLSSWQSYNLYGQNISLGIKVQRTFLVWAILYFPIRKAFYYQLITIQGIKYVIQIIGIIELVLFIGQYLLSDSVSFLYVDQGLRYGTVRYYFQPILIDLLYFVEFDNFIMLKGRKKIVSSVLLITCLLEVMVVQKLRLTSIALILCIMIGTFIAKGSIKKKFMYIIIASIFFLILFKTILVQDVLNELFYSSSHTSTLSIRESGRALYLSSLTNHPLLGGGYPHEECYAAYTAAGLYSKIYLVDNGIFGFMYIYGGIGLVWLVTFWFKMLLKGWNLFKKSKYMAYLLFPIFFLVTGINEMHWYWMNGFMILIFFLALQEQESEKKRYEHLGKYRILTEKINIYATS